MGNRRITMGDAKRKQPGLFEPISENQRWKIHCLANERPALTPGALKEMISDLIGLPDVNALSKQEASHIIERLSGPTKWTSPPPPRTASQINEKSSGLPYHGHICFIRNTVKDLGWSLERFKDWMFEFTGRLSIGELNREQARKLHVMAMDLLKQRN